MLPRSKTAAPPALSAWVAGRTVIPCRRFCERRGGSARVCAPPTCPDLAPLCRCAAVTPFSLQPNNQTPQTNNYVGWDAPNQIDILEEQSCLDAGGIASKTKLTYFFAKKKVRMYCCMYLAPVRYTKRFVSIIVRSRGPEAFLFFFSSFLV